MLSPTMETQLNEQMNFEFYSAYLYLAMAAYFESIDRPGSAKWMHIQFEEEMTHVKKYYEYIGERDGRVRLDKIDAPPLEWDSPLTAFENAYAHEQEVSKRINALVDQALAEKDHPTSIFLQWFVTEQVEEEANVNAIVKKLKFAGEDKMSQLLIEQELEKRESES